MNPLRWLRDRRDRRDAARTQFYALISERRTARLNETPVIETAPGPIDATYLQLEGMYAAPDYAHEEG